MPTSQEMALFLNEWGSLAVLISLAASIVIAILGLLPSIFMTGANVLLFGAFYGFLLSWLGELLGAFISFHLYKAGFKKQIIKLSERYDLVKTLNRAKGREAGWVIFQARLLPFVPSGIVTFSSAMSSISIRSFIIATALGKLPSILIEVLVSYNLINRKYTQFWLTAAAIIGLLYLIKNRLNNKN